MECDANTLRRKSLSVLVYLDRTNFTNAPPLNATRSIYKVRGVNGEEEKKKKLTGEGYHIDCLCCLF